MPSVRPLEDADLPRYRSWRGGDAYLESIIQEHLAEHRAGKRVIFVALAGDSLIGTLQIVFVEADADLADGRTSAYLQALDVKAPYRRRGIATRLVAAAAAEAKSRGRGRLTVMIEPDNGPSLGFFGHLGFAEFKRASHVWRGETYETICLDRSLGKASDVGG
jgi:GNAT superfamily N-acetyltransferase